MYIHLTLTICRKIRPHHLLIRSCHLTGVEWFWLCLFKSEILPFVIISLLLPTRWLVTSPRCDWLRDLWRHVINKSWVAFSFVHKIGENAINFRVTKFILILVLLFRDLFWPGVLYFYHGLLCCAINIFPFTPLHSWNMYNKTCNCVNDTNYAKIRA